MRTHRLLATLAVVLVCSAVAAGKPSGSSSDHEAATGQANNPLADVKAFNFQNYYVPELTELDDQNANTLFLRTALPFGNWLMRAGLPISKVPTSPDGLSTSGLGDFNAQFFYLIDTGNPAVSLGVGPQLSLPTATEDETGTDKYQAGLSAVYYNANSKFLQWGGLVSWQTDVAGSDSAPDTSTLLIQPFYFFQLGKGYYFRGAAVSNFNLETNDYHVPLGLGLGRVVKHGNTVYNFIVEPQFTILSSGPAQPELQLYFAVKLQFK